MSEAEKGTLNVDVFEVEALKLAMCPICLEMFCPPVFQCANGHLICSGCSDGVQNCPTCKEEMPHKRIRCLAVENLVSLKCSNFKWGCRATLTRNEKADHELLCKYRSRDYCNHMELKKLGIECNEIVNKFDLPSHMKDKHQLIVIENNEAVISQELDTKYLLYPRKWFPALFSAFDDFFFLDCEITRQPGSSGTIISWKCIYAGSVANAQFSITMKLIPTDKGISSLKWEGNVISVDQLQEKDLHYFSLTMNTLNELTLCKSFDKLSWKVKVVIQRKSSTPCFENPVAPVINMSSSMELAPPIYQIIEGTYKPESGGRWWGNAGTVYSRNGSLWTRKVTNQFEYSFTFGQEVTYKFLGYYFKSTITIEDNKLIHREKQYLNGKFLRDVSQVEEFADNKMLTTDNYGEASSFTAVYNKLNV